MKLALTLAATVALGGCVSINSLEAPKLVHCVGSPQWNAQVPSAALRFTSPFAGLPLCKTLIYQLSGERIADAINLLGKAGDCLVLTPVGGVKEGTAFFLDYGGLNRNGVPILYLADVPQIRIWNGQEITTCQ